MPEDPSLVEKLPRSQRERRAAATAKLIDATIALIGERGLEGFSITDVGERAGLSRGLPGHYFKSREGLVEAAVQALLEPPGLPANPGLQPLLDSIGRTLSRAQEGSGRMRAFLTVLGASHEGSRHKLEVARFYDGAASLTEAHLRAGIEAGAIDSTINPSSRAPAIVAALVGEALLVIARPEEAQRAELKEEFVELIRWSLASSECKLGIPEGAAGTHSNKSRAAKTGPGKDRPVARAQPDPSDEFAPRRKAASSDGVAPVVQPDLFLG